MYAVIKNGKFYGQIGEVIDNPKIDSKLEKLGYDFWVVSLPHNAYTPFEARELEMIDDPCM